MKPLAIYLLFALIVIHFTKAINIKLTKLQCEEYDKPVASFRTCRLKALDRRRVALHIHVELHQVPVNNVSVSEFEIK